MVSPDLPFPDTVIPLEVQSRIHANGADLQTRLDAARAGDTLDLPPGEYQGPFLVDKPLTLRGRGNLTPLWTHECPVILVTCAGVLLDNLLIETTVSSTVSPILTLDASSPTLKDVLPSTLRSQFMSQHQLIDLGDLIAGKRTTLTFEFDKSQTFNDVNFIGHTPLLQTEASKQRNRHNLRRFRLVFDIPNEEGRLLEQIVFSDQEQRIPSQTYLLKARVSTHNSRTSRLALTLKQGKQDCTVYFEYMLELSHEQIALLSGGKIKQTSHIRYGIILPAYDRNTLERALWIPSVQDGTVYLNNAALPTWTRRLLKPNDVITAEGLEMQVREVKPNAGRLQLDTFVLDFGRIQGRLVQPISVNLTNRRSGLRGKKWIGKAHSLVDWLIILEQDIEIPSGKSHTLEFTLDPERIAQLKNGDYVEPSAIALFSVENEKEFYFLDVHVEVALPPYEVQIQPLVFKGVIGNPLFAGELKGQKATIKLENVGRKEFTYHIASKVPWLEVVPTNGQLMVNESAAIECKLTEAADALPAGTVYESDGLSVFCVEANREVIADVTIEDIKPPLLPHFEVQMISPRGFVFNLDQPQPIEAQFSITNRGTLVGEFRVSVSSSTFPSSALLLSDTQDQALPHDSRTITLTVDERVFRELSPSHVKLEVSFEGGKIGEMQPIGHETITVDIVDEYPILRLAWSSLELDPIIEGRAPTPEHRIRLNIENIGTALFAGEIVINEKWLRITKGSPLHLAPNQQVVCEIALTDAVTKLPQGRYTAELDLKRYTIPLRSPTAAQITLNIMSAAAILYVMRNFLWFGSVQYGAVDNSLPEGIQDTVILVNMGHTAWRGKIAYHVPWLRPEFTQLVVPPLSQLKIPVHLVMGELQSNVGMIVDEEAIIIQDIEIVRRLPSISARLFRVPPRAVISLSHAEFDLGAVVPGYSFDQFETVEIINNGAVPWTIKQVAFPEWLNVKLTTETVSVDGGRIPFTITPNESYSFEINQEYRDSIQFFGSDDQSLALPVSLEVRDIEILTEPQELLVRAPIPGEIYPVSTPFLKNRDILRVTNKSPMSIPFVIQTKDTTSERHGVIKLNLTSSYTSQWIKPVSSSIQGEEYVIPPGEEIQLRISIKPGRPISGVMPSLRLTFPNGDQQDITVKRI